MVKVLFVCLGNICRSPAAEGVFRVLVAAEGLEQEIAVDSAGTGDWHIGKPPDPRTLSEARRRGIDLSALRGRRIETDDFRRFDYVLAMDDANFADLEVLAPSKSRARLRMFLDFAPDAGTRRVPDPYYGGQAEFAAMFDLIEVGARGLLAAIRPDPG